MYAHLSSYDFLLEDCVVLTLVIFIMHLFLKRNDYSRCVYITWTNRNHDLLMYLIVNSDHEWLQ